MRSSIAMPLRVGSLVLSVIGFAVPTTLSWGQDYRLVEPSGVITADVYMRRGGMTVNDASGVQYQFQRDRSFDSFDGRYAGYWLPSLNRIVRFPRSGSGRMQVADLDDAYPHYVFSRRSVRPARGGGHRPGHHHGYYPGAPFVPPAFQNPYLAPGYGYLSFGSSLTVWPTPPIYTRPHFYPPPIQSIVLESRVVPRDPLPAVTLNLVNSAQREVRVTVSDRAQPDRPQQIRIAPGGSQPLRVERDAGSDLVRTVLTYAPDGSQITREVSTPIAPSPRYELTVHEWRLQSVAIDRTGKSPNVIEDTNYQGRGLGRFELPPGDAVTGGALDVVRAALQADNAGAVAPMLDPETTPGPLRPVSPLERLLQQQRRASEAGPRGN